jgi:mono/diheme cytochrome c family protein
MFTRSPAEAITMSRVSKIAVAALAVVVIAGAFASAAPGSAQTASAGAKTATAAAGNVENGKRIYSAYGCYECHGLEGQGSSSTGGVRIGPPPIPLEAFRAYIRQPANQMPPYTAKAVSDSEVADIYAFLLTRPTPKPSKDIPLLNK